MGAARVGAKGNAPCLHCVERRLGCHGQCKEYMEYAVAKRRLNEQITEHEHTISAIEYHNIARSSRRSSKTVKDGQAR